MAKCPYYISGPWDAMQEYNRVKNEYEEAHGGYFSDESKAWREANPEPRKDWREQDAEEQAFMDSLMAISDVATVDNPIGFIASFPVADGSAMYRVERTNPLTLGFIPYMDAYDIPEAHMRGLRLDDIKQQIRSRDTWKALGERNKAQELLKNV